MSQTFIGVGDITHGICHVPHEGYLGSLSNETCQAHLRPSAASAFFAARMVP